MALYKRFSRQLRRSASIRLAKEDTNLLVNKPGSGDFLILKFFWGQCMAHNPPRIDLFSDTKTRPSTEMRKAMCAAEVGDEQADEDPTTINLCEIVADLMGHEKALFLSLIHI